MTRELFEALLQEDESTSLDFKQEQYPFEGATDAVKSELLKDILAFSNAWRRTEAYILIGVKEVRGGRHVPVGVAQHLQDAALQQFVNGKTQRPVVFAYETFDYGGALIGIIRIAVQERPFYLKKDYGKLKRHIVYVRRGSSTAEADPDEVARMGSVMAAVDKGRPELSIDIVDPDSRVSLGTVVELSPQLLRIPLRTQIPEARVPHWSGGMFSSDYLKDLIAWIQDTAALVPFSFSITNSGARAATDVRVRASGSVGSGLRVLDEEDFPDRPTYHLIRPRTPDKPSPDITVEHHGTQWSLTGRFGTILPQETVFSRQRFYLGSDTAQSLDLEASIFAHELEKPVAVPLSFRIAPTPTDFNATDMLPYFKEDHYDHG